MNTAMSAPIAGDFRHFLGFLEQAPACDLLGFQRIASRSLLLDEISQAGACSYTRFGSGRYGRSGMGTAKEKPGLFAFLLFAFQSTPVLLTC